MEPPLTDAELAEARRKRAQGEASLACEGLVLLPAERALFDRFERERLPHAEFRRQILAYLAARQGSEGTAAAE